MDDLCELFTSFFMEPIILNYLTLKSTKDFGGKMNYRNILFLSITSSSFVLTGLGNSFAQELERVNSKHEETLNISINCTKNKEVCRQIKEIINENNIEINEIINILRLEDIREININQINFRSSSNGTQW
jgi:hypothetical protein